MNVDPRFANDPAYNFAFAAYYEKKQINRNISLAFQRGNKRQNANGQWTYTLDDPHMVLDGIKNTPKYWQKARYELNAKCENLGPFDMFFTLSCADIRWPENFTAILDGHNVTYTNEYGEEQILVDGETLDDFLAAYPSKHNMIKTNLLNATFNFQHRLLMFIKHIIMSENASLPMNYFNYRIEFQFRGAPHAHGVLWVNWEKVTSLPQEEIQNYNEAKNLIRSRQKLSVHHKQAMEKVADLAVSVSLRNPAVSDIVKEVQVHRHTAKACRKYGTDCRFNFPKFPTCKTVISTPSNFAFESEEEKDSKMVRYTKVIKAVKEVLEDEEKMKKICSYKQVEMDDYVEQEKNTWRLRLLLQNAEYHNNSVALVPEDLQQIIIAHLSPDKKNQLTTYGTIDIAELELELESRNSMKEEIDTLIKERIEFMLKHADFDISQYKDVNSKLEEYENALSVNKRGYAPHYKRDVAETMVNTYNPEWISAWNGNMDIQLCLDFFAVITYISDYYSKDDSGTMELLLSALKDAQNDDLRSKLKKVGSAFLTHRQMGESEAYYRTLPHMLLKLANVQPVFAPTGFNPSHFLERIDDDIADKCEDAIEVEGREGKYREKASMYDKYLRRDCEQQPELKDLCYAQFVKRYRYVKNLPKTHKFGQLNVPKSWDHDGNLVFEDKIVTKNMEEDDYNFKLPSFIKIKSLQDDEPSYVKLSKECVLRFHKFKKDKNLHEHLFSELQLYLPHTNIKKHGRAYSLEQEREDLAVCQKTYAQSQLNRVKNRIMPFLETVEEGMEAAYQESKNTIGDMLDPENEQDRIECEDIGLEDNPDYAVKDFSDLLEEDETAPKGLFKTVTLSSDEEIQQLIHRLDDAQRMVVNTAMKYIKQIKISRKINSKVVAPRLIIQGGAGSGKSTVIHVLVQLMERHLRQSGDNLENPYVLPLSFTGTAAANIDGMTLHSAFNFPFSNEFLSLPDKLRDEKRDMLKNLRMIVLDEFSMLKADMLYQIDLRMRELKENSTEAFGGCAVFMFGDLLQLKPVMGKYIFDEPASKDYHASYYIESLWKTFEVVHLLTNHRQGEDKQYADILNRIRSGEQTSSDCRLLQERVRPINHPDLPKDALYVTCLNKDVNTINEAKLDALEGVPHEIEADIRSSVQKNVKPKIGQDGSIFNTPLQKVLKLKVGAKVMLTYNIDVMDSLTNGAIGEVVGFQFTAAGKVKTVLVHFKNEKVGRNLRKNHSFLQQQFPGIPVTPIEKIEFRFSMSKKQTNNQVMTATQFPLKLAFACTAHKMQGATIPKPDCLIVDLRRVREPAQAYVMLSRVQAISQLFIIENVSENKIYPSTLALAEVERLSSVSINSTEMQQDCTLITSLNIHSLPKHFSDLSHDYVMKQSKMICIQETWCTDAFENNHLMLEGFNLHFTNRGNGKGIVTYYKNDFFLQNVINDENYQMTKFFGNDYHVINVYRSQGADTIAFINALDSLIIGCDYCYIVGDFNINFLEGCHPIVRHILSHGFIQLVDSPTHEEGSLLDHAYVKSNFTHKVHLHWPYYSDHAGVCIERHVLDI